MSTLKEQQYQLRERAIVEAMYELLVKNGYASTSMDDVAAQLGISKATLYLHFKSKTELALRVIIQQIEESGSAMKALDESMPAIERLKRSLHGGIQRRITLGKAQIELLPEEILNDPTFQAVNNRVAEAGGALIEEAQRQGDLRTNLPAGLIQQFISNTFNMDFEQLVREGIPLEQLSEQVVDLVIRAIQS